MVIIYKRKRYKFEDVFEDILSFKNYLIENYNKLNFDDERIIEKINFVYYDLIQTEGIVQHLRLYKILPNKFGFKYNSIRQLQFWEERGFDKEYFDNFIKIEFNFNEKLLGLNINFDTIIKYKTTEYHTNNEPVCNTCNSKLIFKKNKKGYTILSCSNNECDSNKSNSHLINWKSFLPKDISDTKISILKNTLKSNNYNDVNFHIKNGNTLEDSIKIVSEIQSKNSKKVKNRFIVSKDNLRKNGFTEDEINDICKMPSMLSFWIDKGFTEDDAKKELNKNQINAIKNIDFEKRLLPSNIEYWLKLGFNEEESKDKVSNRQRTFTLEKCIEKYGEVDGLTIWQNRQLKWQKSLYKNGNIKGGYSKISQELFDKISINFVNIKYSTKNGELCLRENDKNYYYDFVELDKKRIIEYNGDQFHANPNIYDNESFPHPYKKKIGQNAENIWYNDMTKMEIANNNGYDVLYIWDSDYKNNKEEIIQKCIDFLNK